MVVQAVGVVGKPPPSHREGERLLQAKPDVSLLCGDCETPLLMEVGEEEGPVYNPKERILLANHSPFDFSFLYISIC
jgi:hypothetical protein